MNKEIDRNYLEMFSLRDLVVSKKPSNKFIVELIDPANFQLNKFFYKNIGKKHRWVDRLVWTDKKWIDYTVDKKVKGIKVNNSKIINSDYVICNSDPPNVYNSLIKSKENYDFLFKQKMKRMDYSMGLFVYYFGSKKKYENVAHHTIYFGNSYKEHLNKIFEKKELSEDISYYLHRPSATDPNMSPDGQDAFYVLVPVPNNLSKINWVKEGEKFKNLVLDKMDQTVLPGIKENVLSDFYLTPDYFEIDLATKYGSGFSIQPKFSQSAYFRFHNQSEIFKNLYFVGAGTHPGAGMPGVLSSAKVLDKLF